MANASPAYRLAVTRDHQPVTLEELQRSIATPQTLLLQYLLGHNGSYLLVLSTDGAPRLVKLAVDDRQASALSTEVGTLTSSVLKRMLTNEQGTGLSQRIRSAEPAEQDGSNSAALFALWELLVPEVERKKILSGQYQQLIVIPDGPLASLPFETLVVEPTDELRCLLDAGPPIIYAPSATVLMNLEGRKAKPPGARPPVLTVGNPQYRAPASEHDEDALAQPTPRSRYRHIGGDLPQLPYTQWETSWISRVFTKSGVTTAKLTGDLATERSVRHNVSDRRHPALRVSRLGRSVSRQPVRCPGADAGERSQRLER